MGLAGQEEISYACLPVSFRIFFLFDLRKSLSLDNLGEYLDKWVEDESAKHDTQPGR